MKTIARALSRVAPFLLAFSSVALAGSIQVRCLDPSNDLLKGAKITVTCLTCPVSPGDNPESKDEKSNGKGIALFDKLDTGIYRVHGRKSGFAPALYEYVELADAQQTVTLEFLEGRDRKLYFEDFTLVERIKRLQDDGMVAFDAGRIADAERMLKEAISLNPSDLNSYPGLATVYFHQGKFDEGETLLKRLHYLASLLERVPNPWVSTAEYTAKKDEAQTLLNKIPVFKAENAYREKNYEAASAEFRAAIENNPNDAGLHAKLAAALANLNNYKESLSAMDRAIELAPGNKELEGLKRQIVASQKRADLEKAQGVLKEGDALLQAREFDGALGKFEEALSLLPEEAQGPVWNRIGLIQSKLNQPGAAEEAFKKSIRLATAEKRAEYIRPLFELYLYEQKYEEALTLLADPQKTKSAEAEKIMMMAAEKYSETIPELSELALERTIRINPGNLDACFELGRMYYTEGAQLDLRTRELLTRYRDKGGDPEKLEEVNQMLVGINQRSPE